MDIVVASQCLESAYGISIRDVDAHTLYPLPGSLQQIFSAGLTQMVGIHLLYSSSFSCPLIWNCWGQLQSCSMLHDLVTAAGWPVIANVEIISSSVI